MILTGPAHRWAVALVLGAALAVHPLARADEEEAPSDAAPAETPAATPAPEAGAPAETAAPEAAAPESAAEEAAPETDEKSVELMGEGDEEEAPAPEAAPTPAPAPKPKPRPKPRPRPKPKVRPAPAPRAPASPFEYLPIEDFEKAVSGTEPGAVRRAGTDPKPQFTVKAGPPGCESGKALTLTAVPALADGTVWSLVLPAPLDCSGWRGLSVRAKSSAPTVELKIGVTGGGSVYASAVLGTDWSEVRLDFARAVGRGRFDPRAVREIVITALHELNQPADVTVDGIAAWRERVPSEAVRSGMNIPPVGGPFDWRTAVEAVNCAPRAGTQDGLALGFWSAPLPYQHWPAAVEFRDLPRGLAGATGLVARVKVEPAVPQVLLKFTLVEARGERFATVRTVPEDGSALRLPLAEFMPDAVVNLRQPPAEADGILDPASVTGWSLAVLPATERQCKGTVFVQELWGEGAEVPKPVASPPAAPKPKPKRKPRLKTKPAPPPVAAPLPDEEPPPEEAPADGSIEMEQ